MVAGVAGDRARVGWRLGLCFFGWRFWFILGLIRVPSDEARDWIVVWDEKGSHRVGDGSLFRFVLRRSGRGEGEKKAAFLGRLASGCLLFVAVGLDAFAVFVLGHLGAAFLFDGTHVRAPWCGWLENDLVEGQFDDALRAGGA